MIIGSDVFLNNEKRRNELHDVVSAVEIGSWIIDRTASARIVALKFAISN